MISCKEYANIKKEEYKNIKDKMSLSIIQVGDNPAAASYVKGKVKDCNEIGVEVYIYKLPEDTDQVKLSQTVMRAATDGNTGIIIPLPLPEGLYLRKEWIWPFQDVDGMFYDSYSPCTPEGIIDWLEFNGISLAGRHVVIIGRSNVVGRPLAKMMIDKNATVTLCHSQTRELDLNKAVANADIIVSAVGKPKIFKWDVPILTCGEKIFIDVGINRDENGKMCGDLDYEYLEAQGHYITPVPEGVGLLTRVALLKHLVNPKGSGLCK